MDIDGNRIIGNVPKAIRKRTQENMDKYNLDLSDAFDEACRALAKPNTELYKAWYYGDFRRFIPTAYNLEYMDFNKYPLRYAM